MIINFSLKVPSCDIPRIIVNETVVERISSTKVLGVYINSSLSWNDHISYIYSKASKRVFNIILLKRAGVNAMDLSKIYCAMIRSILEYAAPVWHAGITQEQSDLLESVQKRVLKIIVPGKDYTFALDNCGLSPLSARRELLTRSFFSQNKKSY